MREKVLGGGRDGSTGVQGVLRVELNRKKSGV